MYDMPRRRRRKDSLGNELLNSLNVVCDRAATQTDMRTWVIPALKSAAEHFASLGEYYERETLTCNTIARSLDTPRLKAGPRKYAIAEINRMGRMLLD